MERIERTENKHPFDNFTGDGLSDMNKKREFHLTL